MLGERIAGARKALGKSQKELGLDADVERSLISKIEAGHFETINESVQKVCTALGLDPRNTNGKSGLDSVLRRLSALSAKTPQLLIALDGMLDVLESVEKHGWQQAKKRR